MQRFLQILKLGGGVAASGIGGNAAYDGLKMAKDLLVKPPDEEAERRNRIKELDETIKGKQEVIKLQENYLDSLHDQIESASAQKDKIERNSRF